MASTLFLVIGVLVANIGLPHARGDFLSACPSLCSCKWSSGKRVADCSYKSFTAIPSFQTSAPDDGFQVLNMDGNYIKELGKDAFSSVGLVDLQKISIRNCQIQIVDENAFSKLNILTEINLDGNNITKLPGKAFDGNKGLRTLILSNNRLEYLQDYQFPPLANLKKVDLSKSGLVDVSQKAFNNLGASVEEIDLSGNRLTTLQDTTFLPLPKLKTVRLNDNPWVCDCRLKSFRDYVSHRSLNAAELAEPRCAEPDRLADKPWNTVKSLDFACKPKIKVYSRRVYAETGWNATLTCHITGNPVPSTRWVLGGRVIHDKAAPLHSTGVSQQYVVHDVALGPGGIERNFSLTITNVQSGDEGDYNCVAINQGGMAEKNITLTFDHPTTWPGEHGGGPDLTVLIGAAAGGILFIIVLIITLCCVCRRGKDKTGHTHNGSLLAYSDPANEKLLSHQGTLPRTNPVPKPPRTAGEYGMLPMNDTEMHDYGPTGYISGDRYDEYGEGRTSASNSDQTGTLSRASYHSSDPEQYPDLLDIPNRFKQASPTSICTAPLPPVPYHPHQPLHPAHLVSPPAHHHHHHPSPFARTGTLPHNYTMGTLPHHPRSVSCDHTAPAARQPGYVTLPRRPRSSWAGVGGPPRDTPSPSSSSFRDPIYDGVGPRTSADGSSSLTLNRSGDGGAPRGAGSRVPINGTSLPPYIPRIDETPEIRENKLPENKRGPITSSQQTLLEENLAAYCEPWGAAVKPSPANRDSIASNDSDTVLPDKKDKQPEVPVMCSTPKSSSDTPTPPPALSTIHEGGDTPTHAPKRLPPPTLPKPKPRPPPKPKVPAEIEFNGSTAGLNGSTGEVVKGTGEQFQDETADGSEV